MIPPACAHPRAAGRVVHPELEHYRQVDPWLAYPQCDGRCEVLAVLEHYGDVLERWSVQRG